MFNMTNADEVAESGAMPVMEEIGPFVYQCVVALFLEVFFFAFAFRAQAVGRSIFIRERYNKVKVGVEFLDGGSKIKYYDWMFVSISKYRPIEEF
jgi:hypothetical protein